MARRSEIRGVSLLERSALLLRNRWEDFLRVLRLRERVSLRLIAAPKDPVLGDIVTGEALIRDGVVSHFGLDMAVEMCAAPDGDVPHVWSVWLHSFRILRDLAAAGDHEVGAPAVEPLVRAWLATHAQPEGLAWRPDILGRRLSMWCMHAPYILSSRDVRHRAAVLTHIVRGARQLEHDYDKAQPGLPWLEALGGLWSVGLLMESGGKRAAWAEQRFSTALDDFLPPEGVTSRCSVDLLELLELLLCILSIYDCLEKEPPEFLEKALSRGWDELALMCVGTGGSKGVLPAFHGSAPGHGGRVRRIFDRAQSRIAKTPPDDLAEKTGFCRLAAQSTVLLFDAGVPPRDFSERAHAGTLAFEMSDEDRRLIVNCGGVRGASGIVPLALQQGLRTTAAHSTLILNDMNSTRVPKEGGLGDDIKQIRLNRHESEQGIWVEASHDGYRRRAGFLHLRRLFIAADGADVRGEDSLVPASRELLPGQGRWKVDVRFHLAVGIEAIPTADAKGAFLRLPGNRVWHFRSRGGDMMIAPSLVMDEWGAVHPSHQIVLSTMMDQDGGSLNWSLKRKG